MTEIDWWHSKYLKRARALAISAGPGIVTGLQLLLALTDSRDVRKALGRHDVLVRTFKTAVRRTIVEEVIDPTTIIHDTDLPHTASAGAILRHGVERAQVDGRDEIKAFDLLFGFAERVWTEAGVDDAAASAFIEQLGTDLRAVAISARDIFEARRARSSAAKPNVEAKAVAEAEYLATRPRKRKLPFGVRTMLSDEATESTTPVFTPLPSPDQKPDEQPDEGSANVPPQQIDRRTAVMIAYSREIENIAAMIRANLSVLVKCDKSMSRIVWREVLNATGLGYEIVEEQHPDPQRFMIDNDLFTLRNIVLNEVGENKIVIIPNLDLISAGGHSGYTSDGAREAAYLLSRLEDNAILAFAEPATEVPEILGRRFAMQQFLQGIPLTATSADGEIIPFCDAIITQAEREHIESFDPHRLHKTAAGLNVVQVRQAISYLMNARIEDKQISMHEIETAMQKFKPSAIAKFQVPDIKFEDVGGYADVKKALTRAASMIEAFDGRTEGKAIADPLPKGFVLHGPPGTGKTLLAKAVANQLKANIVVVSGPEVMSMWVGDSERQVRDLFQSARAVAPSVIIFEEFDAIASKRSDFPGGGARANNGMVTQLLTELDGFRPELKLLVVGTTNRIDMIDEALLRPSRLQSLLVDLPDDDARRQIIEIHSLRYGFGLDEMLTEQLIRSTKNFNGDEIQSIFRDALVARRWDDPIFDEAGGEVSDAFLFGRMVQTIRDRTETERRTPSSRRGGAGRESNPTPSHELTLQIAADAWETQGMFELSRQVPPAIDDAKIESNGSSRERL